MELTPSEQQSLAAAQKVSSSLASIAKTTALSSLRRPDKRTREEYREDVHKYLVDYRTFLCEQLQAEYLSRKACRFNVTLVNPTDRVFESVQVKICLHGRVKALVSDEIPTPRGVRRPARPRPFGTPPPLIDFGSISGISPSYVPAGPYVSSFNKPKLVIDNSASARITYPSVTLRPRAQISLDEVALIVNEPPGSVVTVTWEATAMNAEGRAKGSLPARAATTPLDALELLAAWPASTVDS